MLLQKIRGRSGFTLIEVIIVIAIFAILATVVIPSFLVLKENLSKEKESKEIQVQEQVIDPQEEMDVIDDHAKVPDEPDKGEKNRL